MTGRDRTVLIVVGIVGVIAACWLLVISPKRDQASHLETQIQTVQTSLSSAQSELSQAEAARSTFRSSYATLVRLGEAVPTDDNVPSLIYQIQSAASSTGVDFRGLTLNPAGPGGPVAAAPSPTPSTSSSSSTTPAAPGAPAAASSPAVLPPGAAVGASGFPIEPFTFTFQGNFFHLANFFGRLQRFVVAAKERLAVSGRLLSLDAISLTPSPSGFPQIEASVSATTYLLPSGQGVLAGATPAGPAGASSPQQASTPTTPAAPAPAAVVAPVSAK
ncbi:MAG: type II secretion system protein GspM [Solirubrobacteraceae bacterium]